jgi:hypothetical protein
MGVKLPVVASIANADTLFVVVFAVYRNLPDGSIASPFAYPPAAAKGDPGNAVRRPVVGSIAYPDTLSAAPT